MDRLIPSKLNTLLSQWPNSAVLTAKGLRERGYYKQLLKQYADHGWLRKIGYGAYTKLNEPLTWQGAVYALQQELQLPVHVGGVTALAQQGLAHYLSLNTIQETVYLFNTSAKHCKLPKWFIDNFPDVVYEQTHLFSKEIALVRQPVEQLRLTYSAPERAILEVLLLTPKKFDFMHAGELVEQLQLIRADVMQSLLEQCTSIKVKRLFLYLAEKYQLPCFAKLNLTKINLGSGKRVLGKGGQYHAKWQLSLPKMDDDNETNYLDETT